ncbi:MAG: hypothetical protein AAGB11_12145 [Pseudomonadota bacterium]
MTDISLWWIAVVGAVVVTVVVALLLTLILRTARDIEDGAAVVWANGQRVANNTIHIPLLYRTDETASEILQKAGAILRTSQNIAAHAQDCSGCPKCILGGRG